MWAIVPIKTFERAKQRLSNVLTAEERRALMLAMARDVLTCLTGSARLTGILIVSRAREADALAEAFGTERFIESPTSDLAGSLTQATHYLRDHFDARGIFVVPADVPCISTAEVDAIIGDHGSITLLPDAQCVGTNGLICSPPLAIPYIFNGKSFKPHSDLAFAAGLVPRIIPNSSFALDADTPDDLIALADAQPTSQSAIYLQRSGLADRLRTTRREQGGEP